MTRFKGIASLSSTSGVSRRWVGLPFIAMLALLAPTIGCTNPAVSDEAASSATAQALTASFQSGANGYVGTKDVQITNQSAANGVTTRTGTDILLYRNTGTGPYESQGLLRFDAISLPAGSTVTGATLRLTFENWVTGFTLRGYYLNASWNPSEGSGLGWLDRFTGTAWATPGARGMGTDLVANKTFTISGLATGSDVVHTVSLDAAVVQGWINNPATNHGILLFNETADKVTRVYTSDHAQVSRRPLLTINYSTGSSDTVPPTVALTAPASGATLVGNATLSANASDDQQLAGVQFLADGVPIGSEDTTAPYSISYDTRQLSNGSHSFAARARDAAGNQATSAAVVATVSNTVPTGQQTITLVPNGGTGANELVSVGVPFPAGALTDSSRFRVLDNLGAEVPIFVKPTLRWHWLDNSIRALKVQFFANMSGGQKVYTFTTSTPRNTALDITEQAYQNGTLVGKFNYHVPRVLAALNPEWMCSSRIAGPQKPKTAQTAYDSYFETQFAWAKNVSYTDDFDTWLFDRPTAIYKQYIRTGNTEYLKEAFNSYRFYIDRITTSGVAPGGFEMTSPVGGYKDPRDVKYLYIEPVLLHLALTGDDTQNISGKVPLMADRFWSGGWHFPHTAYTSVSQAFTERQTGLMLLAQVAAYEITGNATYLSRINTQIGHFYNHQQNNPDGLPYDGSWRHDWNVHEGGTGEFDPEDQRRGGSPWMSENIIDGLWHAWLVTADTRIPTMVKGFALDFMENYGFGQPSHFAASGGVTWRHSCNEPNGTIALYWSSSVMTAPQIVEIMNSDGWYSDGHNPESALPVAAAYYFSTNATERQILRNRTNLIELYYNTACANISSTVRKFNWNHRGSSVSRWMLDQ
jgi:hypothetical protein